MQHLDDPWFIALSVILVLAALLAGFGLRTYVKEWIILAMALPPAVFRKVFGPPRH